MISPHVTVLTAVRNGAKYLGETIADIQAQTYSDWEYILVDDASEDGTSDLITSVMRSDPRLRLMRRKTSAGPYTAANDGLRVARGEYIVRIDGDDLCPSNRIATQLKFLKSHPEYRACVSYWQARNDGGPIDGSITQIPSNPRVFRWALLLRGPSIHSTLCIERSAMQEIGGYRELPLSQDYRLWCETTRRGWLGTIPEVLCYVRYHDKRETNKNSALQTECAIDVLRDHIEALTGRVWSRRELETLRSVGMSMLMPVHDGLKMLDRWDRLWQADNSLTSNDRIELAQISAFRRWKHLRSNARRQPVGFLCGLLKLAATHREFFRLGTRINHLTFADHA